MPRRTPSAFFYLDTADTVRRAALFTGAVTNRIPAIDSLNREYAQALAQTIDAPLSTGAEPRVVTGGPILRLAKARGLVDNSVSPSTYNAASRAVALRHVQHALLLLRLHHPPLRHLCDLLITDLLCWPSVKARGGSAGNLLGVVWIVPSGKLTSVDLAELVVHEMVHLNISLADITLGLFSRAPGSEFKAHSAVLGRPRPHYFAFHSACVAVALIYFRMFMGLNDEIDGLRSSLQRCTAELLDHKEAFTSYSWKAIQAAHAFSRAPKLSAIPVHKDL